MRLKTVFIVILILGIGLSFVPAYPLESAPITIGVIPCDDAVRSFKKFYPLADCISRATRIETRLIIPSTCDELADGIRKGLIDFAFLDSSMIIGLSDALNADFILKGINPQGSWLHSALVISRKDRDFHDLPDLKGKTVLFGKRCSAGKWFAAVKLFEQGGIDIKHDLKYYSHVYSCVDIALNVYLGKADAGVICDYSMSDIAADYQAKGLDSRRFSVIGKTEPVPEWIFMAGRNVDREVVLNVNRALLELHQGSTLGHNALENAGIIRFDPLSATDFGLIRRLSLMVTSTGLN